MSSWNRVAVPQILDSLQGGKNTVLFIFLKKLYAPGEMSQVLMLLAALSEEQSSVPSIPVRLLTTACDSTFRATRPSSDHHEHCL